MAGLGDIGHILSDIENALSGAGGAAGEAGAAEAAAGGASGLLGRLGSLGGRISSGLGSSVGQLFVWQVLGQVLGTLMGPSLEYLRQQMNEAQPVVPLSPADLSTAVVRNFIHPDAAAAEALKSGVDGGRFQTLVNNSGLALSPQELAEAERRGLFSDGAVNVKGLTFEDGIRQGDLKDQWGPFVKALAKQWPSPTEIVNSLVQGQVPGGSTSEQVANARALFTKTGGDPQFFDLLYHTAGASPSPDQAAVMARRGIIPWDGLGPESVSYEQAFREGRWRNKWSEAYRKAAQYYPPPRTIEAMLRAGAITEAKAAQLLTQEGMPPDLIKATLAEASHVRTAAHKTITVAQILDMYGAGYLAHDVAEGMITAAGYPANDARILLAYRDLQNAMKQATFAIDKVRSMYVGHKITAEQARGALGQLGVPSVKVESIMHDWTQAEAANVKTLTAAQIAEAFYLKMLTQDQAMTELTNIGYTPLDAWTVLSIKNKAALPDKPAPGPGHLT